VLKSRFAALALEGSLTTVLALAAVGADAQNSMQTKPAASRPAPAKPAPTSTAAPTTPSANAKLAGADSTTSGKSAQWAPPGTKGSEIDGTVFHAQVLLDTAGFPTGVIDGKKGMVFKKAVSGFQQAHNLPTTGELDGGTRNALLQDTRPSTRMFRLSADDVAGPFIDPMPKEPEEQAKLPGMYYRNMLEKLAERFHTTPKTILALNGPDKMIGEGETLRLPNVLPHSRDYGKVDEKLGGMLNLYQVDSQQPQGDFVVVDKSDGVLRVYKGPIPEGPYSTEKNRGAPPTLSETPGQLVAQFPVTMGSGHDPLPLGKWKATTYAFLPPFHYQPSLFWDAKDKGAPEQTIPAGPNGPVGVAWLDLTKEHYGIHGTPSPETIGRAESHGCIRMSNWDVIRLSRIMKPGFTAIFQS
jgi:L,D-transpeptidase catalytic domain/Putative peptidoglycan binding domain